MSKDSRLSGFLFNGDVNRRSNFPNKVFVDGNVGADSREAYLKALQEERKKRENERLRDKSALKIQSYWRGSRQRQKSKAAIRTKFDTSMNEFERNNDVYVLKNEIIRLHYFFNCSLDGERLIWLCKHVLRCGFLQNNNVAEKTKIQFLVCCLKYLSFIAQDNHISIALPVRCVESFLGSSDKTPNAVSALIFSHLFVTLRKLIDYRVPNDLSEESLKAPTPLAESLVGCAMFILNIASSCPDKTFRKFVFQSFLLDFIANGWVNTTVTYYVLPFVSTKIKLDDVVDAVIGDFAISFKPNANFTCVILHFIANCAIERSSATMDSVRVLSFILPALVKFVQSSDHLPKHDNSDDEGDADKMEFSIVKTDDDIFTDRCTSLLFSDKICNILLTVADSLSSVDTSLFNSFIGVCSTLTTLRLRTSFQQQTVDRVLFALSLKPNFLIQLWSSVISCTTPSITGPLRLIEVLQRGSSLKEEDRLRFTPQLSLFCELFSNSLLTANDQDFYQDNNLKKTGSFVPFSLSEMAAISSVLRDVTMGLIELALPDVRPTINESYRSVLIDMGADFTPQNTTEWNTLFKSVVRLLVLLHDRDDRLQFCPIGHWCVRNRINLHNRQAFRRSRRALTEPRGRLFSIARFFTRAELAEKKESVLSASELRTLTMLRKIPFVIPFEERVVLLYQMTLQDQQEHGRVGVWHQGMNLHVRRNFIYEDSYDKLSHESAENLKLPLKISMANWAGVEEAGIDGGGIFREFLNELLKSGFNPLRGLFVTTSDQLLYPNPLVKKIFPDDYRRQYHFLGRMLGKMIYENQLAELPFARFFLSKLLGRRSGDIDIHHLSSLDPILHKNLVSVKNMDSGVSELYLDFTVMMDELGDIVTYELKPNGKNIPVTNENRLEYVHLMADFYLNKQIKEQTESFRDGVADLIDLDWLQMFDHRELQILISGADRSFDLYDLKENSKYSGEATEEFIGMFWDVVESFTDEQKRKLLKFVTGCSRAPLLGFKDLHPPFTIQVVSAEEKRLPTAATCMNLLKLPHFKDGRVLREKLSYAIEAGAGFELS